MNTDTEYYITKNDLKYKKLRNLDKSKISNLNKNNEYYDKELDKLFDNNNFDTIEFRFDECIKDGKKILDLKYLELKEFPKIPNDIIKNLEELYISNNDIEILPDLDYFINLKILDIAENKLKKIGKLPPKLIELCCFENKLEDISSVKDCKVMRTLYISNNRVSNLQFLDSHPRLEILLANFNNIEDIPRNIPYLKKIQIRNNKLKKVKSYPKLIYLDCRHNNIRELENQDSLRDLILSYNDIQEIPVMNSLRYLEIVNTNIEKIRYMKQLVELICMSDKVKYISSKYKIEKTINHKSKYLNLFFIPETE
jgi:Leucine-rich repeat (LRR) protein